MSTTTTKPRLPRTARQFLKKYPDTKRMSNCLTDLACPKCGSRYGVTIEVKRWTEIKDDGTDDIPGDTEYDEVNPCRCLVCEHEATVGDFTFPGLDEEIAAREDKTP